MRMRFKDYLRTNMNTTFDNPEILITINSVYPGMKANTHFGVHTWFWGTHMVLGYTHGFGVHTWFWGTYMVLGYIHGFGVHTWFWGTFMYSSN